MNNKPKVSIVTIAYNQEKYIRQTLDSFVMQKTDFDFEAVVADDCSTDRTPEIIQEYANKYPDIFSPILRKKNIGAVMNCISALRAAKGSYIAFCEGDDYWTDPKKLQKQADFMDSHPDHALCFHPVRVFFENGEQKDYIHPDSKENTEFSIEELLRHNFIQTNSVMYRKQKYDKLPDNVLPLDWYLHLYHAQFGKIGFINQVMSAYRRHPGGLWWDGGNIDGLLQKHGLALFSLHVELLKLFGKNSEDNKIIYYRLNDLFSKLLNIDKKYKTDLAKQALAQHPDMIKPFLAYQADELSVREKIMEEQKQDLQAHKQGLEDTRQQIHNLTKELNQIHESKSWKLATKISRASQIPRKLKRPKK